MGMAGLPEDIKMTVFKCLDGKYRWLHETNLYRNYFFLFYIWKIFFFIWLGVAIFILLISVSGSDPLDSFRGIAPFLFYTLLLILVLLAFSYFIYALLMGGKYSVLFEMDQKGVSHLHLPRQFKKAEVIGALALLAGLVSRSPGAMGAGILALSNQSMHTEFKKVNSIKANPKNHVIKLRFSTLAHNQIYTAPEDFAFVLAFIEEQVKRVQGVDSKRR